MSAAIDSMILVYAGIVPEARERPDCDELDELRVRAKLLLFKLARQKSPILLSTIVVSELLVPLPATQRGMIAAKLSELFVCVPFGLHASAIAADLRANLPSDVNYQDRHVLKADILILASVKAAGATEFYTNDKACRALADRIMKGCGLPADDPDDMFLLQDLRHGDVPPIESQLRNRSRPT